MSVRVRAAVLLLALAACRAERGRPEDLRGVFDAAADATASAAPSSIGSGTGPGAAPSATARRTAAASDEVPRVGTPRRKPTAGPCLATSGEPSRSDERAAKRPSCRRADILEHRDGDGSPRYGCVFAPAGVEKRAPLPLVVYFHAEDESLGALGKQTEFRSLAEDFELGSSVGQRGYVLLTPQARRIRERLRFDVDFVSSENADVRATDRFVDSLVKRGWIDATRVYAVGFGTGGRMAALWAMLRADRVAAFATVAGNGSSFTWTCLAEPPPAVVVYRACDAVASCPDMEQWIASREQARAATLGLRLGPLNDSEPACVLDPARCKDDRGTAHHQRWPKGRERDLLSFLGRYSLELP